MNPLILAIPDFSMSFTVQTDASLVALGTLLLQGTSERRCAVFFASRTFSSQERMCSTFELEAIAVMFGNENFRMYLRHAVFELETECQILS